MQYSKKTISECAFYRTPVCAMTITVNCTRLLGRVARSSINVSALGVFRSSSIQGRDKLRIGVNYAPQPDTTDCAGRLILGVRFFCLAPTNAHISSTCTRW